MTKQETIETISDSAGLSQQFWPIVSDLINAGETLVKDIETDTRSSDDGNPNATCAILYMPTLGS